MGLEDLFDWDSAKARGRNWLQTASSQMETAYRRSLAWVQREYEESVGIREGSDALESAMASRRQFLREVPYIYRLNFVVITTGLVFLTAPGAMRRVSRAGLVGALGVLLVVPEVSPWKRR